MKEKPWWKSRTVWSAVVYGATEIGQAFGLPIPEAVPAGILALLLIFLRLGNGTSIK